MWETLLGGLFGGIFRLVPEFLKWMDRKDERKHEKDMFDKQIQMDTFKSQNAIAEIQAQGQVAMDAGGLQALVEAIKGQAQLTGNRFIDGLNSSVRPIVTYWMVGLYAMAKTAGAIALYQSGVMVTAVLQTMYTGEDRALLAGILNFWFLDRVIRKQQGQ